MGSFNNALRMLFMLKTNKVMKVKEIAEQLEVNERQVRRYKDALEEYFEIDSIPGKGGGYMLKNYKYFPFKQVLSSHEINMLNDFINSLDSDYLVNNPEIVKIIEKINLNILEKDDQQQYNQIIPYSRVTAIDEKIEDIFNQLYLSILECTKVIIEYRDNNGKISKREIEPYQFITYKGEKYLVAFCLLRNEIRFFKLRRITSIIRRNVKFQKSIDVKKIIDEYKANNIGIFSGDIYKIKLEIRYPVANIIKERIWVENQVIDDTTYEDRIIFEAEMKGGPEIESWILSMGDTVKIIEPLKLRNKIHEKLVKMIKNI